MQPPVPQVFPFIISKNECGISHFSLSPSSLRTDCPDVCNNHCMREPCITWSFKGGQEVTYKLTRKLMGTWGISDFANHDSVIELQTQLPISPFSFPLNNKVLWDQAESCAFIPLPKFHLYNPWAQEWSKDSYSQELWLSLVSNSNPWLLPDPGCYVCRSGLRSWQQLYMPLITPGNSTSFLYSQAPSTCACKMRHRQEKNLNIYSIIGNSGPMISVHC